MSPKNEKKRKIHKSRKIEVSRVAIKILRTLNDQEAFYFYETIGKPTGENAKSLSDFLEKIKSVKLESILFHLQRKDFQNWIKKTLGDSKLAEKIGRISPSCDEKVRMRLRSLINNRIKELRKTSPLKVIEDFVVTPLNSTQ